MNFRNLVALVEGAKKNRAGAVYKRAADASGPSGRAAGVDFGNLNPEKRVARKEPVDLGRGSTKSNTGLLRYALEIVGSFSKERGDFGRALEIHVGKVGTLRVYVKRYQGLLQEIGKLQRSLDKENESPNRNQDRVDTLEDNIQELEVAATNLDNNIRKLDDNIERNLQGRVLLKELSQIIKDAAQKLSDSLTPQQKENISRVTDLKSFEQLDVGQLNITDPEQLLVIRTAILRPDKFMPLEKFYDLSMGERQDARDSGSSYYFKDPIFHLASIYKTASLRAVFGKERGSSLKNSHTLKSATRQSIGDEIMQIADAIKGKSFRIAISNLQDYDFLSDSEKRSTDSAIKKVEDLIHTTTSIDQDKKSKLLNALEAYKKGNASESAVISSIYSIKEGLEYNTQVNDYLIYLLG